MVNIAYATYDDIHDRIKLAIEGGVNLNIRDGARAKNIHTMSEGIYRGFYYTMRTGESNVHSILFVEGALALYRRSAFKEFEDKHGYSDDIGTGINIVSNGYRCIYASDAVFYDNTAFSLRGRIALKSRRAEHLIGGVVHSLKLKIAGKFPIPWSIVFFNFYLHVLSPTFDWNVAKNSNCVFCQFSITMVFSVLFTSTFYKEAEFSRFHT